MPLAGKGMLLTSMDIDPSDEAEFNRWYDREHLEERVAIEGFVEARRYLAHAASPKYLSLYSTQTFDVLDSPAYRTALANQTAWSKANIARFRNMIRAVARITVSRGTGRGAALGLVRLRPAAGTHEVLRAELNDRLDPTGLDRIISMHLIESDPKLSKPLGVDPDAASPGAGDWFVLIDGTDVEAVAAVIEQRFAATSAPLISTGTYRLMWDLARGRDSGAKSSHHLIVSDRGAVPLNPTANIALPHEQARIKAGVAALRTGHIHKYDFPAPH